MLDNPTFINSIVRKLRHLLILTDPLTKVLRLQEVIYSFEKQRVAEEEQVTVATLRADFTAKVTLRAADYLSVGRIYSCHM